MTTTKTLKHGAYYVIHGAEYDIWWAYQIDGLWVLRNVNATGYRLLTDEELIEVDRWGNYLECAGQGDTWLNDAAAAQVEEWRINAIASALLKHVNIHFS
jgi:hypothetical protein